MKRTTTFALILWLALLQGLAPLLHAHAGQGGQGQAIHTHTLPAADHAYPADGYGYTCTAHANQYTHSVQLGKFRG